MIFLSAWSRKANIITIQCVSKNGSTVAKNKLIVCLHYLPPIKMSCTGLRGGVHITHRPMKHRFQLGSMYYLSVSVSVSFSGSVNAP